nr:ferredoxin--nitrite reductase, chloroplastic-like [Ipomoea batatas]
MYGGKTVFLVYYLLPTFLSPPPLTTTVTIAASTTTSPFSHSFLQIASLSVKFLAPSLQIHPANKLPKTTRLHATPPQTVGASPPSEINAARLEPRVEERDGYFVLDLVLHVKNGKEKKHDHQMNENRIDTDIVGQNEKTGNFSYWRLLDAWVPADDIFPVCKAIMEAFRDLGV